MDYEELEQRVEELEEQKTKLENEKEELENKKVEAEEALEEQKKQLDGEKDKDKNFKNLRDKKDKIEADKTDLETKYTELEEEIKSMKKESIDKEKESYLNRYAGDDEDERKKIEDQLGLLSDEIPMEERMAKAVQLAGVKPGDSETTFFQGVGFEGDGRPPKKDGGYLDTDVGKAMAESLEIDLTNEADKKKEK